MIDREPAGVLEPLADRLAGDIHLQNLRQPRQKNFTQPRVARHVSPNEARDFAAAAKARDLEPVGQMRGHLVIDRLAG